MADLRRTWNLGTRLRPNANRNTTVSRRVAIAGWGLGAMIIAVIIFVVHAGVSDVWRKTLFYGGAVLALALKAAGWVVALPWGFAPVLAIIGVLTEPDTTASQALDSVPGGGSTIAGGGIS